MREVAVQRPDADAGVTCDLACRNVDAVRGEQLARGRHETRAIALRVTPRGLGRDGHPARVAKTELLLRFGGYDVVVVIGYVFWSAWSIPGGSLCGPARS